MIKKLCCSRFSLHKFFHLKFFWTQFKNVHLRGPCSLRPCISRPYCRIICEPSCWFLTNLTILSVFHIKLNISDSMVSLIWRQKEGKKCKKFRNKTQQGVQNLLLLSLFPRTWNIGKTIKVSKNYFHIRLLKTKILSS